MKYKNSKKEKLHYEAVFLHEEKRKEIIDYSNTSIKVIVVKNIALRFVGRYEIGTWILHGKQRHVLIQLRI